MKQLIKYLIIGVNKVQIMIKIKIDKYGIGMFKKELMKKLQ